MRVYLLATLTGFAFSLVLCLVLIPVLRKLKAGQNILSYVKEHKNKSGTPTMGGLAFVFATLIATAVFMREAERSVVLALAIGLAYMVSRVSGVPLFISWYIVAATVVFSFIVGLFFGAVPAVQAARLNPIDALRRE